jgi:hypothetical protein
MQGSSGKRFMALCPQDFLEEKSDRRYKIHYNLDKLRKIPCLPCLTFHTCITFHTRLEGGPTRLTCLTCQNRLMCITRLMCLTRLTCLTRDFHLVLHVLIA